MNEYKKDALNILSQFPENPARKGLEDLVLYVTERKY
jgi:octaprenyl-diphosphate synthase